MRADFAGAGSSLARHERRGRRDATFTPSADEEGIGFGRTGVNAPDLFGTIFQPFLAVARELDRSGPQLHLPTAG